MSRITLSDVSYVYGDGTPFRKEALNDVTVSFTEGKITGIVGHTGSGKSTMLELICGLLVPTKGQVLLDGIDIHLDPAELASDRLKQKGLSRGAVRRRRFWRTEQWRRTLKECKSEIRARRFRIGLVMQYPEYQLFDDTVLSDIAYGPRNMGLPADEVDSRAREAAAFVGLRSDLLSRSPFDLSGGEKRRVAIAGVLAMKPDVLILDEPAAGLDPIGRQTVFDAISAYNRTYGATILLVSHSMEDLAMYCHEVVVVNEGTIDRQGTVSAVFSDPERLRTLGLDVPQITDVASRLIEAGVPLSGDLFTVDGVEASILAALKGGDAS